MGDGVERILSAQLNIRFQGSALLFKNFLLQISDLDIRRGWGLVQKRINKLFSTLAISIAHVKVFSSVEKRFAEFFVDLLSWVLIFLI